MRKPAWQMRHWIEAYKHQNNRTVYGSSSRGIWIVLASHLPPLLGLPRTYFG